MGDLAQLAEALTALLWPVIVIIAFFVFRPVLAAVIESAKSRKFKLKIGGQELTMEEANEQQLSALTDLQSEVIELKQRVNAIGAVSAAEPQSAAEPDRPKQLKSILWADDEPRNNGYMIQQLRNQGVQVRLALSTSDALREIDATQYDAIISDMGRVESERWVESAGIELLKAVRDRDTEIPFFFFTSRRSALRMREVAEQLGANGITSSGVELFSLLNVGDRYSGLW